MSELTDKQENLADYLLRNPPPQWDYKEVLRMANKVAAADPAPAASEPSELRGRLEQLYEKAAIGEHVHTTETERMDYCRICWERGRAKHNILNMVPEIMAALARARETAPAEPRDKWIDECARRIEQWLCIDLDHDTDPHDWTVEQWAVVREIAHRAIKSMWQPSTVAALATAPATETEEKK